MNKSEARFIPNTAALAAFTVGSIILSLLQVKLLSGFLEKEVFGFFAFLRGLSLLVAMISATGFPALLVRFLPVCESKKDSSSAIKLFIGTFGLTLFMLSLFILITLLLRDEVFGIMDKNPLSGSLLFWFYLSTVGLTLKLLLYGGLNGLRRFPQQSLLELSSLAVVLMMIYLKRSNLTLEMIFSIMGVVSILTLLAGLPILFSFMSFREREDGQPIETSSYSQATGKEYRSYWVGALGLSLVAIAFSDVDRYLLARVTTLELLAIFHIGSRVIRLANRFLSVPNLAFQPEVTRLKEKSRENRILFAIGLILKFNTAISVLFLLTLIVFAREIVLVIANEEYLKAIPLMIIMGFSLPLSSVTAPITTVMKAMNQIKAALLCDLVWAAAYILLLFGLGIPFGINGVGVAYLLACFAQLLLAVRASVLKIPPLLISSILGKLLIAGLLAFSPCLALGVISNSFSSSIVLLKIVLYVLALFLFRLILKLFRMFRSQEKKSIEEMLGAKGVAFIAKVIP